jgi:hypothetical protein
MCMPNKQKMQNYGYFDILYFKDRSDRDPEKFWIAIAIRSRTPTLVLPPKRKFSAFKREL